MCSSTGQNPLTSSSQPNLLNGFNRVVAILLPIKEPSVVGAIFEFVGNQNRCHLCRENPGLCTKVSGGFDWLCLDCWWIYRISIGTWDKRQSNVTILNSNCDRCNLRICWHPKSMLFVPIELGLLYEGYWRVWLGMPGLLVDLARSTGTWDKGQLCNVTILKFRKVFSCFTTYRLVKL